MKLKSILYVEDDAELRWIVTLLLKSDDCRIVSCGTGKEAIRAIETQHFDGLIVDVGLPDMSGIEVARAALSQAPQRAVLMCTGYEVDAAIAQMGPNVRAIMKPFDNDALIEWLNAIPAAPAESDVTK
ncbi:MAG: response regulator [Burkholderiales bacterium]|nr:response regulator [Burkholderiales bacterium]